MADREKVIKGLECCISEQSCKGCPYNQSETGHLCSFNCIRDAIDMLKEQEQNQKEIREQLEEVENIVENEVHPVVSPDNWYVYSSLHDELEQLKILLKHNNAI